MSIERDAEVDIQEQIVAQAFDLRNEVIDMVYPFSGKVFAAQTAMNAISERHT